MPVYEYECKECGNRFEKMQPITADPLLDCPHCGQSALRRVFQPVGVIFKGSGWYITDSRKSDNNTSSTKDGDKPATSSEKSETTSETTSETKNNKLSTEGPAGSTSSTSSSD